MRRGCGACLVSVCLSPDRQVFYSRGIGFASGTVRACGRTEASGPTDGTGGTDCHSQCAHWLRNDTVFARSAMGGRPQGSPLRKRNMECGGAGRCGERTERCQWQRKRGERVAAVKISSVRRKAAQKFWAPQQDPRPLLFFYTPVMVSMTASSSGSRVFCIRRPSSISMSIMRPSR